MQWLWKARIQRLIASLPASNQIYLLAQRTVGGLRAGHVNFMQWFEAVAMTRQWVESTGQSMVGKRFLEVGTGRLLGVPTALWLRGAEKVVTVDKNRYLSASLVSEFTRFIRRNPERTVGVFGAHSATELFRHRFEQLVSFSGDLDRLLKLMNVQYIAPGDAARLPLLAHSIDCHVSFSVFEHVPRHHVLEILKEARRVLVPGGMLIHWIDLSDHFAHSDVSITKINFLRFDEKAWSHLAGNKFMYHNRLRACEFLEIYRDAGFEVAHTRQFRDDASLEALRNGFPLSNGFKAIPPEELAVTYLQVYAVADPAALSRAVCSHEPRASA